jgi:tetratricopeptide (TPR) repeat protein
MMAFPVRRLLAPVLITLSLTPTGRAEAPRWPVPVGPHDRPAPVRYDPTVWKGVPAEFLDDAAACYLYSGTTQRLEADGTVAMTALELIRLNGRKGIDHFGEYRTIRFVPAYERITLHAARVHKAKGGAVDVGPRNVQLRDVNTDHLVYDPSKQLVISFPGLEVGDVIEVHWTTRGRNPELQGQFFSRYSFGNVSFPVVRDELCVRVPAGRTLKYAAFNRDIPAQVSEEGGERVYRWRVTNLPPPPKGDHLPSVEELRPQVAVSTFASWDDVRRWDRALVADRAACPAEVSRVVAEVTRGLTDPADKARALARWVRGNVRYVSAGETHDYTPHPPAQVLAHRAGDCKDTAHLYAVMARCAGLRAAVASLGMRGDGQVAEGLPSAWSTHAVAVVTIDGRDHWVDLTANLIGWDELPADDCDRACFITDESGLRLGRTPKADAGRHRTEHATEVTVRPDGSARCERVSRYTGYAAWAKRADFVGEPKGERRRLVAAELMDAYPKARLGDLTFDASLDDPDRPLAVRAAFDVPDLVEPGDERTACLGDHLIWPRLLSAAIDPERTAPLDLGDPFESVQRFAVRLPPAFRFGKLPAAHVVESPWGRFEFTAILTPDRPRDLELVFHTRLEKSRVEPSEFPGFRQFLDALSAAHMATVVLQQTAEVADAPELEAYAAAHPADAAAAAALAELYLNHGRPADAARVLAAARRHRPDDRTLWELSLDAAECPEDREPILRAMALRFADDPQVTLELGATLVEAAKHDEAAKVLEPLTRAPIAAVTRQAHVTLAASQLVQEDPKAALRHLRAAAEADRDGLDGFAWQLRGEAHEALGQRQQAYRAFREAYLRTPDDEDRGDIVYALVRLATALKMRAEALEYLTLYRLEVEDDPEGLGRAADAAVRLGRFDDAQVLLDKARSAGGGLTPEGDRAHGLILARRGDFAGAVESLQRLDPDAESLAALLDALIALGHLDDAERQARRVRQVEEPTDELNRLAERVACLAERGRDLRAAVGAAAGAPEVTNRAVGAFVCAESLHAGARLPERVTALLEASLADGVRLGPAFGLRAVLHLDRGRLAKALADAERAIEVGPDDARAYYARGRVRLERGAAGALDDLERAATLSQRRDGVILHHLAAALHQAGRRGDAVRTQRDALGLRPGDAEVREQLTVFETK